MKAQEQVLRVVLLLVVGALGAFGAARSQIGPGPFAAFPTQDAKDGRFMGFGCAGLATFEQNVQIGMAAPAGTTTFDVNVFDGDTGGVDGANQMHWDLGTRQLKYSLYADPTRSGTIAPANLIGQWFGNAVNPTSGPLWTSSSALMPDNDWWAVTVSNSPTAQAPSGNYFYLFVIDIDGPCGVGEQLETSIKIAASNPMTFRTPRFGLVGGLRQNANDIPIIYPGSTSTTPVTGLFLTAPTTYDGTFEFYFSLPGGETELRLFDGDFDYGTRELVTSPTNLPMDLCEDSDDPDTDPAYTGFPFPTTGAIPEGAINPGSPPDDTRFDLRRRGEPGDPHRIGCVRYEVTDPEENTYFNDNPSGSFEWEQFLIAHPSSPEAAMADAMYEGPSTALPGGVWKVKIIGLDLSNLNFWYADTCATRPARDPMPGEDPDDVPRVAACSDQSIYILGDFVWADTANPGTLDPGEVGIPGVLIELVRPSDGEVIGTAKTGDTTSSNWSACVANNTGSDLNGLYCFGMDSPGTYEVRVAASNFDPGQPLAGKSSTTGGNSLTLTLAGTNVLTYDFGYDTAASLGDRVWLDTNGDGVQDAGESGINGATVELLNSGNSVIGTKVTSGDGNYTFTGLPAGTYSVRVVAATLPPGLAQTYDLDGFGTANIATTTLAFGQNRTDVDFGYRGTASVGDRVWADTDGDGVQDAGETGINGVTVELIDSGNTVIETKVTSGDGNYTFTNLVAGNYSVRVVAASLPAGMAQTFDLDGVGTANVASFTLAAAQNKTDVDFGYRNTASVGDRVWFDSDGDGVQDAGEVGGNGVTVELLNSGGTVIGTQVTSGDGNYNFTNLAAGTYSVRVATAVPAGVAQTFDLDGTATANIAAFALAAGQNKTDVDFGYRGTASIGDRVWTDTDGDGVQDSGETGINGVTVELLNSGGTVIATRVTAGDGTYSFTNLLPGNYSVRVVTATLPAGVVQTFDLDGTGTVNVASFALAAGQNRTDVDFGYRQPPTGSLGDRVWNDLDGDGAQDAGEVGLNGVTVRLLNAANMVIATQVTATNGNYSFTGLMAGTYTVEVDSTTLPAGFGPSYDLDGVATPHRAVATLTTGQTRTDVDFGYRTSDSETCAQGAYANPTYSGATGGHSFWLPNIGTDFMFAPATGSFVQHADGTARLTGVIRRIANPSQAFIVDVVFSGFTMTPPPMSPKKEMLASAYSENGGPINTATFKYYPVYTGKLTGIETFAGAVINITAAGPAFQLGIGANNKNILYGGSGWFLWNVASQPTGSAALASTGQGDINVDLGNCASCANEANNNPAVQAASANHVLWLPGIGTDFQFSPIDGTFVRNADGTAHLTGTMYSASAPTHGFTVDITFSGFTATAGAGSPKKELAASAYSENGGPVNTASWTYYKTFTGSLTGVSAYAGASISITNTGPAFQMGVGANNKNLNFGGSGWYLWTVTSQPTSGSALTASGQGDINLDVLDCPTISYGSIGNRVWNDVDGDGVQDTGEVGINGVTVRLVDTVHAVTVATATTSGDGGYSFTHEVAGSYRVEVVSTTLPSGHTQTFDLDGIASASAASFTLAAGQNRTDVDFGYRVGTPCTAGYVKDNFSTASFSNNNGTLSWAGAWIESDTAGSGVSSGNVLVGTPYSGYLLLHDSPDTGTQPSAARQVNLSGFASATLQFTFHTTSGVDTDDAVVVEVSSNGGTSYAVLETFTGIAGATSATRTYNISSYIASNTRIRFRVSHNYGVSDEYFKVDTVRIDGSCAPPPPTCTAGYVKDNFGTASFSNDDGTLSWSAAWVESDTAESGVSSGNVTVGTPYSGYLHLHDSPDTGTQPSAARQANLTGFASATLQFTFHTTSGVDSDDAAVIEVSNNGGSSYTVLETITGITGATSATRTYNVSSYRASNTRIRFRISKNYGVSDEYFKVDTVRIDGACAP